MNFEKNIKKIQEILAKLEKGQATLEESILLFEEAKEEFDKI